jgi:hypothetical protein
MVMVVTPSGPTEVGPSRFARPRRNDREVTFCIRVIRVIRGP